MVSLNLYQSVDKFSSRQIDGIKKKENMFWHFMQIVSNGDYMHGNFKSWFPGKVSRYIKMSSAENFTRVLCVKRRLGYIYLKRIFEILIHLIFTTLWDYSADDKLVIFFFLFFQANRFWQFIQIVSFGNFGNNMYEMLRPFFLEKKIFKIFQNVVCWIFLSRHAKH